MNQSSRRDGAQGQPSSGTPATPLSAVPGPTRPSLDELMTKVARGDSEAFTAIVDRVGSGVFGLVKRVLRDPAQSEEVTQDVLVDVWRTAPRFSPDKGNALSWIMTMAHRRAV